MSLFLEVILVLDIPTLSQSGVIFIRQLLKHYSKVISDCKSFENLLQYTSILGYGRSFKNIFNLVDELGIKPFTNWTKSAQYSEEGLEVSNVALQTFSTTVMNLVV